MATTDGKMLVNALYHGIIVTGIAIGYSRLGRMMIGGQTPKLDYTPRDVGMIAIDISLAIATKDILVVCMGVSSATYSAMLKDRDYDVTAHIFLILSLTLTQNARGGR